jgi:WD40 repeat protein
VSIPNVYIYSDQIQESPTLDLTNDCFRFVTGYFEVINTSAPHIYHSALALAPQGSTVRKLYESHAHPFMRVVCGAPMSWDPNTAATTCPLSIHLAVWSPCNRFIATALGFSDDVPTDVLDSVTLQRLQTLEYPQGVSKTNRVIVFSPDSRTLTSCGGHDAGDLSHEMVVVSWDLQTGGIASIIRWQGPDENLMGDPSITYSANGKMVGIFCWYRDSTNIFICNVVSGVYMHSHSISGDIPLSSNIWTHGESLRFATTDVTTITIWEVGFIWNNTPTKVESLSAPDGLHPSPAERIKQLQFLPAPCRLAFVLKDEVLVWDAQNSKLLLHCRNTNFIPMMSFSPDGSFFTCSTSGSDIYLWKESPTGYILHEMLALKAGWYLRSILSQNGGSIAVYYDRTIQLWHTTSFTTHPSSILTQAGQHFGGFLLDFSPDGSFAVVAMKKNSMVTVLTLKSGVPQLTINTGIEVYGLRVVGNTVVVTDDQNVIAWNLPVGGCVPDARMGLEDSSWKMNLGGPQLSFVTGASISPNSHYIALKSGLPGFSYLRIYSGSTGEYLGYELTEGVIPWFAPDGCDIWCVANSGEAEVCRVGSGQKGLERLEHRVNVEHPPEGYPWGSSCGYQVTDDWWVLGQDGKRLLMLPPPWQSYAVQRVWKGQFLVLLHDGLSEPVILEVEL